MPPKPRLRILKVLSSKLYGQPLERVLPRYASWVQTFRDGKHVDRDEAFLEAFLQDPEGLSDVISAAIRQLDNDARVALVRWLRGTLGMDIARTSPRALGYMVSALQIEAFSSDSRTRSVLSTLARGHAHVRLAGKASEQAKREAAESDLSQAFQRRQRAALIFLDTRFAEQQDKSKLIDMLDALLRHLDTCSGRAADGTEPWDYVDEEPPLHGGFPLDEDPFGFTEGLPPILPAPSVHLSAE